MIGADDKQCVLPFPCVPEALYESADLIILVGHGLVVEAALDAKKCDSADAGLVEYLGTITVTTATFRL